MTKRERKDADLARAALTAVRDLAERGIEAHRQLIANLEEVVRCTDFQLRDRAPPAGPRAG